MAQMGNWRDNKDIEIPLDGIGGVNILVKADVHRSGSYSPSSFCELSTDLTLRYKFPMLPVRESSRDRGFRENGSTGWVRRLRLT